MNQKQAVAGDAGVAVGTWLAVVRAYNLCETVMAQRLAEIGVKTGEHEILANLMRAPGMSQQALAQRCFTAKSHVSGLLTSMEQLGWVRREPDPADARAKRLYLTADGETMARRTAAIQQRIVAAMCEGEPAQALLDVKEAMQRVSERLSRGVAD